MSVDAAYFNIFVKYLKKKKTFQELEEEVESVDAAYAQLLKSWQSNTQADFS